MPITASPPRQLLGGVLEGIVVRLAGQDHGAVSCADRDGLVAVGMSRRRNGEHVGEDFGFPLELFVRNSLEVDYRRQAVIRDRSRGAQFGGLYEDRATGERRRSAAV